MTEHEDTIMDDDAFLKRDLDEFRQLMIGKKEEAARMFKDLDLPGPQHLPQDPSIAFETMTDEELFDRKFINDFWIRFPGSGYKQKEEQLLEGDPQTKPSARRHRLMEDLVDLIYATNLEDSARRIVERDSSLDPEEKRSTLKKLYVAMRRKGYSQDELCR